MSANDDSRDVLVEPTPSGWLAAPSRETKRVGADTPRRPGRPLEMSETQVLARIREFATETRGLFRVHHAQPALYARARRLFGSWSAAVRAASSTGGTRHRPRAGGAGAGSSATATRPIRPGPRPIPATATRRASRTHSGNLSLASASRPATEP
jgi:hypothetical protein